MALFKSGNPALSEKIFDKAIGSQHTDVMTVRGTLNKFGILFFTRNGNRRPRLE